MKALVGAFNQEKALVGAFSVIVQPVVEPMDRFTALPGAVRQLPEVLRGRARVAGGGQPPRHRRPGAVSPRPRLSLRQPRPHSAGANTTEESVSISRIRHGIKYFATIGLRKVQLGFCPCIVGVPVVASSLTCINLLIFLPSACMPDLAKCHLHQCHLHQLEVVYQKSQGQDQSPPL